MNEVYQARIRCAVVAVGFVIAAAAALAFKLFGATGTAGPLWFAVGSLGCGLIITLTQLVLVEARR